MNDLNRGYARSIPADRADMSVDAGLRSFMLGVYNKVALGLVLSGALAFVTSSVPAVRDLMFCGRRRSPDRRDARCTWWWPSPRWSCCWSPASPCVNPKPQTAGALYWTIVTLIGASLGSVFLRYTGESVASTFFVTAAAFGGLSLFGYSTKKDLTGFGSFLIMGVFGLIIASIVSIFFKSPALVFAINVLGVLIFSGLIAYDTQRLKTTYYELGGDTAAKSVATNFGALSLYINFVNLFQFLLSLFGGNRN